MASKSNIVNINQFVKRNPKLNSLISDVKPSVSVNKEAKPSKNSYLNSHKEYLEDLSKKRNRSIQCPNYEK
jgi:hypothetical protein